MQLGTLKQTLIFPVSPWGKATRVQIANTEPLVQGLEEVHKDTEQ